MHQRFSFRPTLAAVAGALVFLMCSPLHAFERGAMTLDIERAGMEVRLVGAVLDAVDAVYDFETETAHDIAAISEPDARRAIGERIEWQASYEINFGQMDRGVALGVGVPSEAESPPRV